MVSRSAVLIFRHVPKIKVTADYYLTHENYSWFLDFRELNGGGSLKVSAHNAYLLLDVIAASLVDSFDRHARPQTCANLCLLKFILFTHRDSDKPYS